MTVKRAVQERIVWSAWRSLQLPESMGTYGSKVLNKRSLSFAIASSDRGLTNGCDSFFFFFFFFKIALLFFTF